MVTSLLHYINYKLLTVCIIILIFLFLLVCFSALQEAQDIFGLEFDLSEFDEEGGFDDIADDEDDEDLTPEEITAKKKAKLAKKKFTKKSIYQVLVMHRINF